MDSFNAIIDAFGLADFSKVLGIEESHTRTMKARDSIPPEYWGQLIEAGSSRGINISYQKLRGLRAARFSADKAPSPPIVPDKGEAA